VRSPTSGALPGAGSAPVAKEPLATPFWNTETVEPSEENVSFTMSPTASPVNAVKVTGLEKTPAVKATTSPEMHFR
jgi:hypothetical protein